VQYEHSSTFLLPFPAVGKEGESDRERESAKKTRKRSSTAYFQQSFELRYTSLALMHPYFSRAVVVLAAGAGTTPFSKMQGYLMSARPL